MQNKVAQGDEISAAQAQAMSQQEQPYKIIDDEASQPSE